MKRKVFSVAVIIALAGAMLSTSCIGKFALTSKLMTWNNQIGNKFINELVFFVFWVIPVYEVTALADVVVLNSIEFWSGTNPVASGTKVIKGNDGRYLVDCDGKGYTITSENDGSVTRLDFNAEDQSWELQTTDGKVKLMTFIDDTHVSLPTPDGSNMIVETSDLGLMAYQNAVATSMWAQR